MIKPTAQPEVESLAVSLAVAGCGRIRRIDLIGSRATGRAHTRSDTDLLLVLEPPYTEPRWDLRRMEVEKQRLQSHVPAPPFLVDLVVRTTDHAVECEDVFGTFEWVAAHTGVQLYAAPALRAPRRPRPRSEVIDETVVAWLEDAATKLRWGALSDAEIRRRGGYRTPSEYLWRSLHRIALAVFVAHQVPISTKDEPWGEVVRALAALEPTAADTLSQFDASVEVALPAAVSVWIDVARLLGRRDPVRRLLRATVHELSRFY